MSSSPDQSPPYASFFGIMGASASMVFTGLFYDYAILYNQRYFSKIAFLYMFQFSSSRCCVWNSEIRHRNCSNGSDAAWIDYEIYYPSRHGWYYSYLWAGRFCNYCPKDEAWYYAIFVNKKIRNSLNVYNYFNFRSFAGLGAGLAVGLSGLAAGYAIGIVGDAGVRGTAQQPRLFVGMVLILIFAEVLGLYGLIVALILGTKA